MHLAFTFHYKGPHLHPDLAPTPHGPHTFTLSTLLPTWLTHLHPDVAPTPHGSHTFTLSTLLPHMAAPESSTGSGASVLVRRGAPPRRLVNQLLPCGWVGVRVMGGWVGWWDVGGGWVGSISVGG